ncbi:MAG TPA: hypothetical protein VG371_08465 [Solirubrobacteraceae bacterium]|jgi:hypothetical protein|nr:hypothetical protein [Solirubrobacteraceae bacterium]
MLLRNRPPGIESTSAQLRAGFEHLEPKAIAVMRWLNANKIDYVVVGPVGHAIRGDLTAKGAVAIVPAPYGRNYDRLARALIAEHAGLRSERGLPGGAARSETVPVKLSGEKLARGRRWMLRFGEYDLDVERSGHHAAGDAATPSAPAGQLHTGSDAGARYQELLYEANRFDLCEEVSVQVAAPEDLEHYSHVRRTGSAPEFRVTRSVPESSQPDGPLQPDAPLEPDRSSQSDGSSRPDGSGDRVDLTPET